MLTNLERPSKRIRYIMRRYERLLTNNNTSIVICLTSNHYRRPCVTIYLAHTCTHTHVILYIYNIYILLIYIIYISHPNNLLKNWIFVNNSIYYYYYYYYYYTHIHIHIHTHTHTGVHPFDDIAPVIAEPATRGGLFDGSALMSLTNQVSQAVSHVGQVITRTGQ